MVLRRLPLTRSDKCWKRGSEGHTHNADAMQKESLERKKQEGKKRLGKEGTREKEGKKHTKEAEIRGHKAEERDRNKYDLSFVLFHTYLRQVRTSDQQMEQIRNVGGDIVQHP